MYVRVRPFSKSEAGRGCEEAVLKVSEANGLCHFDTIQRRLYAFRRGYILIALLLVSIRIYLCSLYNSRVFDYF